MQNIKNLDRYRGCLVGGAAGDALGYVVEFSGEDAIFSRYGPREVCVRNLSELTSIIK